MMPTVAQENFSGHCLAMDFGAISPNINVAMVSTTVDMDGPLVSPNILENRIVDTVAAVILTMLFPIRTVVRNLS